MKEDKKIERTGYLSDEDFLGLSDPEDIKEEYFPESLSQMGQTMSTQLPDNSNELEKLQVYLKSPNLLIIPIG